MRTALGKEDYLEYYNRVLEKLEHEKDYVTGLDAATGDGDHWANMYAGFKKLIDSSEELKNEDLSGLLKRCGMHVRHRRLFWRTVWRSIHQRFKSTGRRV